MPTLSNPTFQVDILTGMPNDYRVTGTVNVEYSQADKDYFANCGCAIPLRLYSDLWADDGGFNGADDHIFSLPVQKITGPGIYTFSATIPRAWLNEDNSFFDKTDEIYNSFSLESGINLFSLNVISSVNSPTITGKF